MKRKLLVVLLVFSVIMTGSVKADEAPDPNYLTSLTALGETLDSYLDTVNVTMYVEKRIANGEGTFKITNPSDSWENFSVVFDPGAETYGIVLKMNGSEVETEFVEYDNFYGERWRVYGIRFNVSVPPNGSAVTYLTWYYHVDQDVHKNLHYSTNRLVEYLVIGMLGWSRPITEINVDFVMTPDSYDEAIKFSPGIEVIEDAQGRTVYRYHARNFSKDRALLRVIFKDEEEFNPTMVVYMQCIMSILFISGILGLIYYINWDAKKKREKREREKQTK
jgi:hypothetical protein